MTATHYLFFWFPAGSSPAPEQDNRPPGAGGSKRRKIIVRSDGTRYEPRSDAAFRRAIAEMLDRAELKEFEKPKAPKKRKPGKRTPAYQVAPSPAVALWGDLLDRIADIERQMLTEQAIIVMARAVYEQWQRDEEEAEMLLLVA